MCFSFKERPKPITHFSFLFSLRSVLRNILLSVFSFITVGKGKRAMLKASTNLLSSDFGPAGVHLHWNKAKYQGEYGWSCWQRTPKGVLRGRGSKGDQHWRPERRWDSGVSFPLAHDSFNLTTHAYWFSEKPAFQLFKKGLHFQPNITSPGPHVLKSFLYESCPAACFFLSSQASLSQFCIIKIASFALSRYKL